MIKTLLSMTFLIVFSFAGNEVSITLESNATTVNVGERVQLSVVGTYSDGSSKSVDENITYIVTPVENAEVNGSTLTAKKDGNVTLQAKVGNTLSNVLKLNITWVVNGHVLPPEPDKTLNDSTLLGIDTNDNGVRDDVERWIYDRYKDKHPIHIDISMQEGRAYNQLLKSPLENSTQAKAIHKKCIAPIACEAYYQIYAKYFNEPLLVTEEINIGYFQKFYFNTPRRKELYNKYSRLLSGGMYSTPKIGEGENLCDFNVSVYKD
jgi:hypothetical protein